jgi:N-acetylneuraminic acid mutarotase
MNDAILSSSILDPAAPPRQRTATTFLKQSTWPAALILLACFCLSTHAQTNEWTWMGGSSRAASFGVYGKTGIPASENAPGGRSQPVSWTDKSGDLWLFGGFAYDSTGVAGYLNDLWKFNPSTNEWTWIDGLSTLPVPYAFAAPGVYGTLGTPAAGNVPPGRYAAESWTDDNGNLWLLGGSFQDPRTGEIAGLNDMWEFNPIINEWAWMGGSDEEDQPPVYGKAGIPAPGNTPGAIGGVPNWTDHAGRFWLLIGAEMWEFYPSLNEWAWMGGVNYNYCHAVYGTLGKPAPSNVPGNRGASATWTDKSGNLWMFGGSGCDSKGNGGNLNDLWKYSPSISEWTWMGGGDVVSRPGIYGNLQTPGKSNLPGARDGAIGWTDASGNFWLFGGVGASASNAEQSFLNDLWEYNPSTSEWAWMAGGSTVPPADCANLANWCGQFGMYGKSQTPSLGNSPGGRYDGVSWTDSKGNFWLLGGQGYDGAGLVGYLGDLWEFQPNTGDQPVTATPVISPGSGTYSSWQTVTIIDKTPGATINYMIDGAAPVVEFTGPITVSSSQSIEAIASASGYANSKIATASYIANLPQAATPTFSLAAGTYATAQTLTISDSTPGATIYYAIGEAPTLGSKVYKGPIDISAPEIVEAIAVAEGYLNSTTEAAAYNVGSNPSAEWTWMGGSSTLGAGRGRPGQYGTLQKPSALNIPGGRYGFVSWKDVNGNFWLFGGEGLDADGKDGYLNDLWELNPSTREWTWMSGSSSISDFCKPLAGLTYCGESGDYGELGTAASGNTPGGRYQAVGWTDREGNLWLFGGYGFDASGIVGFLNDVWEFEPSSMEWSWRGGSDSIPCLYCASRGKSEVFGTPALENIPGARYEAGSWTDKSGNFWLYGGSGGDDRGSVHSFV